MNVQEKEFYYTIEKTAVAEFKDRGSKFIAYAYPVKNIEEFKQRLNELKKEHAKATHHCFAYRIGLDGNNYRVSDDGEPSGTAGRPILGQIDSKEMTDLAIIVVRYFGGTLLGVPGLINAYKSAAAMVLQVTPNIKKLIEEELVIQFDYTQLNNIITMIKQNQGRIIEQDIQLFCRMTIAIPKSRVGEWHHKLADLPGIEFI